MQIEQAAARVAESEATLTAATERHEQAIVHRARIQARIYAVESRR